jgi:hypothetical protein
MTYFPDLSRYDYRPFQSQSNPKLLNVGWLDPSAPYCTGAVDGTIMEGLLRLCREPVNRTRGWHRCPYCESYPAIMTVDGQSITLGDGEIRVSGSGGVVFAAPTLICHYIQKHGYRPPEEFLIAVASM